MQGDCWFGAVVVSAMITGSAALASNVYYVNGGCGNDAWSGLAPACQSPTGPKATIQAALNAAASGDRIVVAPGRYYENVLLGGKNVAIVATHASAELTDPLDPAVASIIDGSHSGSANYGCTVCFSGTEDTTCALDGLTITGGRGFLTSSGFREGGGIYGGLLGDVWTWSRAAIRNCSVTANTARFGAGIAKCGGTISGCRVFNNATADVGGGNHGGGGMEACNGNVMNCQIVDNHAFEAAGMYSCRGTIQNCTIARNHALWSGGAGSFCDDATFVNCLIADNEGSAAHNGLGAGGAIFSSQATYINCSIVNNSAAYGGAIYGYQQFVPTLRNCIVWGNSSPTGSQIMLSSSTLPTVAIITYCDLEGGIAGVYLANANCSVVSDSVLNTSPAFLDPAAQDYRLLPGSACIDAGSNALLPGSALTDLVGAPRRVDDPGTPDSGAGTAPLVDMGAFEFQGATCRADFNRDQSVDLFDYLDFVQAFSTGGSGADFNLDGAVDLFDYLDFVQAFSLGC